MNRPQMVGLGLAIAAAGVGTLGLLDSERLPTQDERGALGSSDANHDGRVSQAEWLQAGGHADRFPSLDTDGDGFLDPAEAGAARGSGRKD
ncbi:hypothetical protein AEB_P0140 [Altererythrobacter sp. B11]|uniref:hypothetical protein n=1 Tax=Altererythrobacter sp. B11 TaxID=2060312 RepID=UPI000DC70B98|nr:hypothetical protein [Altererythrobacter sp. B11]BBC71008.1 hypothetical protein AEB_P0140 [Altererythrobacter sp. B11]